MQLYIPAILSCAAYSFRSYDKKATAKYLSVYIIAMFTVSFCKRSVAFKSMGIQGAVWVLVLEPGKACGTVSLVAKPLH